MNTTTPAKFLRPAATIVEKADGYLIEADMPGTARDGIELTVENDTLTITGKRSAAPAHARQIHRESSTSDYRRVFELGREIDRSRVGARFEQGVLQVFLPKSDDIKPRRIDVAG